MGTPMAQLSPYQRDVLIRTALGEARGEGEEGMADVIQVILNRANSGDYPSDPAAVALQPKQFSTWNKGEGGNNPQQFKPSDAIYKTAEQALEAVISGSRPDYTGGSLDYHAKGITPYWASSKDRYGTVERNGHVFYPRQPVPPGEIPNVVASRTDTTPPQQITGRTNAPTSAASREAPTNWFTPRLAPGNGDTYNYRIPDQTNASLEGGYGSLTPTVGQRPPIQLPRPMPERAAPPSLVASNSAPTMPTPLPDFSPSTTPRRLPELPPSSMATDRVVSTSMDRAAAARDPELQAALGMRLAQPSMIDTSMQRAAAANNPQLQAALEARNAPGVGQPPATRSVASVPVPGAPPRPTGPALSRDSVAQTAQGSYMAQALPTFQRTQAPAVAIPSAVPNAIPGPAPTIKTAEVLPSGVYPAFAQPSGVGVASQLAINPPPGFPPMPRPRPARPQPMPQRSLFGMPTPVAQRPNPNALKITVQGGNYGGAPSQPSFAGVNTGRAYNPGQQYTMGGQTFIANPNGSFTNARTGQVLAGSSRREPERRSDNSPAQSLL